ncbi:DNA-directed RNA polymerase I subunit RPA12 [Nosema bombycis CQ1]|uniref:DNA-directed RNA polymerase I subunit RPA12 n=1 Tax=Nosema bombycis (strain CQ1 / CVCC 102059) TaxID=578461 RepID=R0MJ59_NOSB1|nr:DNA-directed RNA polymerase I subunit RPA12 [Nosema bombycis CQ1]|eukprot:EOB14250.1 DNA-directed RNA polymerase I subunit RPA12 [Nosema bombycis CQ1]
MFCACGTLVNPKANSNVLKCGRCENPLDVNRMQEIQMSKKIEQKVDLEIKEVKGAKIKYKCTNCGAEEMMYNTAQLRSADEGQTVFYSCKCGYKQTVQS